MRSFAGKRAVVTGGGGGMGRELVRQLAAEGCSVAACDLFEETLARSVAEAAAGAPEGVQVTAHVCDITDEAAVVRFRDEVIAQHRTDRVNLLFNNAGVFGAGSFLTDDREAWERCFDVCWFGVYNMCRVFVPMVVASDEGHVVNTASVNALRAVHGPGAPSTAYSAGKWAVRGFTEALIEDFRTHAPHVGVSVVFPGGVGTPIRSNSERILRARKEGAQVMSGTDHLRAYLVGMGVPVEGASEASIEHLMAVQQSDVFAMPPAQAVSDLLDAVRENRWRIFIGLGATELDEAVRANPDIIYEPDGPSLLNKDMLISMMTLSSRFTPGNGALDGTYELHLDSAPIICRVADGELELSRRPTATPDATLEADPATFRALVLKELTLSDAVAAGRLELTGDGEKVARFLAAIGT
jgi:NAD(P)-dependent dehydrogenase (short-subunit alcohol dehydrogenase family)